MHYFLPSLYLSVIQSKEMVNSQFHLRNPIQINIALVLTEQPWKECQPRKECSDQSLILKSKYCCCPLMFKLYCATHKCFCLLVYLCHRLTYTRASVGSSVYVSLWSYCEKESRNSVEVLWHFSDAVPCK